MLKKYEGTLLKLIDPGTPTEIWGQLIKVENDFIFLNDPIVMTNVMNLNNANTLDSIFKMKFDTNNSMIALHLAPVYSNYDNYRTVMIDIRKYAIVPLYANDSNIAKHILDKNQELTNEEKIIYAIYDSMVQYATRLYDDMAKLAIVPNINEGNDNAN